MLRGARKNMIVVRTRDSRLFEEAYFVMRRNAKTTSADEMDMLWEANRILETAASNEYRPPVQVEKRSRFGRLHSMIWFGIGVLSGSGLMGLLWYLL